MAVKTKYVDVPQEEKMRLFLQVKDDPRFHEYLHGCYECGVCVAACPSARFYDYSPRKITQAIAREDIDLFYEQLNDDIWNCSQCYSCVRCRRGNVPGGLVQIMREVAIVNGMQSAKDALTGYTRVVYKIHATGTQVSPDMLQPEVFRDWGPYVYEVCEKMEDWRKAIPSENLHTYTTAWDVGEKTRGELYLIWYLAGVLDLIRQIDSGVHTILEEVIEEVLEEKGYDLSAIGRAG